MVVDDTAAVELAAVETDSNLAVVAAVVAVAFHIGPQQLARLLSVDFQAST